MNALAQPGLLGRVAGYMRDKLDTYGTARGWFPPLAPLPQVAPPGTPTRRLDYTVGANLEIQPRISLFHQLREMAEGYDLMRLLIETVKDEMAKVPWAIRPLVPAGQKRPKAVHDPRIDKLTALFNCPDGVLPWPLWLRNFLEDQLVIDAPTIEPILSRGGELLRLDLIDGATITPKIGYDGRTPAPPLVAYQQIIKGAPTVEFRADELIYCPYNRRTHKIYGYSPVEQIQLMTNLALRRELWLLNFFTEGSMPEAYIPAPETWTPDQIKQAQDAFDAYLAGNLKTRRKMIFGPGRNSGEPIQLLKSGAVGGDAVLDELIIRFFCFAFKISAQALVRMMNRATAGTAKEHAIEQGLLPRLEYIKGVMDSIIAKYCGITDLEFVWQDEKEEDPVQQAQILTSYVKLGVMTINESRDTLGLNPVPDGDQPLIFTASGAMTLAEALKPPETPPGPMPNLLPPRTQREPNAEKAGEAGKPKPGSAASAAASACARGPVGHGATDGADDEREGKNG